MFTDEELSQMTKDDLFYKYHYLIEEVEPLPSDDEIWRLIDEYYTLEQKRERLARQKKKLEAKSARKRKKLEEEKRLEW